MTDWSYLLFAGSIYALGFIGLFGVSLLPLRAFVALRRNAFLWHSSATGKTSLILVGAAALIALILGIPQIAGVFRCLTELHCGANRASGWFFLAIFGAYYLAFELFSAIVLTVARRANRVAA
jgi:NADH:ubiquinone oxidoreductase subunit 6 (subunit J)